MLRLYPEIFSKRFIQDTSSNKNDNKVPSTWLLVPYLVFYFLLTTINTLIWPLIFMENICQKTYYGANFTYNATCINRHLTNNFYTIDVISNTTVNFLIISLAISSILALASYFLVWKPILCNCRRLAMILPPLCMLIQSMLLVYAGSTDNLDNFKYLMFSVVAIPALHCNFQGVGLLYYRITEGDQNTKGIRKNSYFSFNGYLSFAFVGSIMAGLIISTFFTVRYSLIFVVQFMCSLLFMVYGAIMDPLPFSCELKACNPEDVSDEVSDSNDSTDYSEDEFLIRNKKLKQINGLFSTKTSVIKEAPLIFSQEFYSKELFIITIVTTFTIAFIADINLSGLYMLQPPFNISTKQFGLCVFTQASTKFLGMLLTKGILHLQGMSHGLVIALSGINYIIYYVMLAVANSKVIIFFGMVSNIFGGVAFPAIMSLIKTNFKEKSSELVLEISTLASLIITVVFTSLQLLFHMKLRYIFQGIAFAFTAGMLAFGFIVAFIVYCSTRVKNMRRSKEFADRILNDNQ